MALNFAFKNECIEKEREMVRKELGVKIIPDRKYDMKKKITKTVPQKRSIRC